MKRNQGDHPGNRDGGTGKFPDSPSDVDWMTNAGADDCKITAARAPLWALVEAQRILKNRGNNKNRLEIIARAMKQRYGVMAGSDESLATKGGIKS